MHFSCPFHLAGTGKGTHVYILDSGIRATHHDIRGRADAAFDAYGGNVRDCRNNNHKGREG